MQFVDRSEWGATYAKGSGSIPGPVLGVTVHWEGPHMGTWDHALCARKVRAIERFHAVSRGWAGIAYTLLACPHGYVFEGRGVGVRSAANGDSKIGGNDQWYAVCYLGGQGDPFTDAGKRAMGDAITYLRVKGAGLKVNGHRDHHATQCPGDVIYAWAHSNHPSPEEDDMRAEDIRNAPITVKRGKDDTPTEVTLENVLADLESTQEQIRKDLRVILAAIKEKP